MPEETKIGDRVQALCPCCDGKYGVVEEVGVGGVWARYEDDRTLNGLPFGKFRIVQKAA